MSNAAVAETPPAYPHVLGHPRPLWMLFMTEFWERFCFYGMRWALTLYIVAAFYGGDPKGEAPANLTYGAYTALVYAVGLLGGYLADKVIGFQRAVLLGGTFIAAGLFTLLVQDPVIFRIGLGLIIVGNGLFKPNISSMVGHLYRQGDSARDRGFTIFYMGINAGAFFAPLITGWFANSMFGGTPQHPNYAAVFACAGVGMVIGLVWFGIGRRMLLGVGRPPEGRESLGPVALVGLGSLLIVPLAYYLLQPHLLSIFGQQFDLLNVILFLLFVICCAMLIGAGLKADRIQLDKIWAMLLLFLANILFWTFFEQAGSSFNFLAKNVVDRQMFGGVFPVAWFQSVNPAAIVLLAPVITFIWRWTDKKDVEPSIPRKFALGLLFNSFGFLVLMWALSSMVGPDNLIPFWPLALCYVLQTVGELCLSPIGLSMVTKLAPAQMVGATMGAWFLSISMGESLAGLLAAEISGKKGLSVESALSGFTFSFWLLAAVGVLLLITAPLINKLMHGVR